MDQNENSEIESTTEDNSDEESAETRETSDAEILRVALERFKLAEEAEADIRKSALEDLEFRSGNQWEENVKKLRESDSRPCLVINRIPQFIRQITNDQRQNRPSIKVSAVDDHADVETAKILQGLIRHIEYNCNAEIAYDTAFEGAVTKSFGYWRVVTDYIDPMSFEQEILIKRIRNAFSVYLDPNAKEPDASDANWGFIFEDMPDADFKSEFKDSKLAASNDWRGIGDQTPSWLSGNSVRVAEYFYKEFKTIDLVLMKNGFTADKSKLPNPLPPEMEIVKERKAQVPVIKWCKINGHEILSKTDWLGIYIPIVPCIGDELDINGKRVLEGIVRHAKDSQRMNNYYSSLEAETIALSPRAPWIVAEGQIPPEYSEQWATSNSRSHAFLPYKVTAVNGQPVPPPQRNVFEPPVQAITQARALAADDMKATTGIYDSALGNRSNENSGIAIQRRNMQSQTSNFHFIDNLSRALRHTGRILIDLIPKIYDTERAVRILGDNGEEEVVQLNKIFERNGKNTLINLAAGKYDVTVDTGPSYATKRQEAVASMLDLTKAYPQAAQVAGDLMVRNMDWPGAQEIADRLKKSLPPGIADDKDKKQQPIPPQIQAQLQQQGQMIEQMTAKLEEQNKVIDTKSMELESKERIEFAKMEVDLKKELLKVQGQSAMATYQAELQQINSRLGLLDINEPFDQELTESGPNTAAPQNYEQQQPTGGQLPG